MNKQGQMKLFTVLFFCSVGLSSFIFKPTPADKYDYVVAQDGSGDVEQGELSFIDNSVDTSTGTIKLKGTFPNKDHKLWPGQFVNVGLRLTVRNNAVVVPNQAVQTGQDGTDYDKGQDLGRIKMTMNKPAAMVENLKYTITEKGGNKAELTLSWENQSASVPITVK